MRREDLEHLIYAAAEIVKLREIVVVGSQAILAEFPDAPEPLLQSQDADLYPREDPERAIEIEGSLGEGSDFHASFGYYAQGVGPETAKAPAGWEDRLIRVVVEPRVGRTEAVIGWCLERHDLVLSKCVADRPRDWEFAEEAIRHDLVEHEELLRRIPVLPMPAKERARVERQVRGIMIRAQRPRS